MHRAFMNPDRVRKFLNSRIVRYLFRWATSVDHQGQVRLEKILLYYGKSKKGLSWMELLTFFWIYLAIEVLRILLRWKKEYLIREIFGPRNIRRATINLARSVAEYGATQPQKFASPLLVVWNFTNACNLKCKHCYQDAGRKTRQLTLKERLMVIDELDRNFVPTLAFSGGEPLCDPELFEVASYAAKKEIYLSVATNGTLLSEDVCKRLRDCGVSYIEISLESADPEFHDQFRGIPGLWKRTVTGIENVLKAGLLVGVAPTITRKNFSELLRLYEFARSLGVHRFYVFNFIPTGRGKDILQWDLSPEEREEMLDILYDCLMQKEIAVFSTSPQFGRKCLEKNPEGVVITGHYSSAEGKLARVGAEYVGGCGAGRAYCAFQPDGTVTPCVFMPIAVGKLLERPFKEIWDTSPVLVALRERSLFKGNCGVCDYRAVCGGCRARAYAYFGDYLGPDPGCKFNASYWQEIVRDSEKRETNMQGVAACK